MRIVLRWAFERLRFVMDCRLSDSLELSTLQNNHAGVVPSTWCCRSFSGTLPGSFWQSSLLRRDSTPKGSLRLGASNDSIVAFHHSSTLHLILTLLTVARIVAIIRVSRPNSRITTTATSCALESFCPSSLTSGRDD